MELTQKKLNELKMKAEKMVGDLGYDIPSYTYKLDRATKRAGCCNYTRKTISVSPHVMKYHTEEKALDTCVHELLHAVSYESFNYRGHTGKWKQLANHVNRAYNMNIKRCYEMTDEQVADVIKKQNKYTIECVECDFTQGRAKTSKVIKHPEFYRCPRCKGKLKIKQNF